MKTEDDRNDSYRSAGAFTGSGDLGRGPGDSAGFGRNAKVKAKKEIIARQRLDKNDDYAVAGYGNLV